jgi:hypothetical protein
MPHERLHIVERPDLSGKGAEGVAKIVEREPTAGREALPVDTRPLSAE